MNEMRDIIAMIHNSGVQEGITDFKREVENNLFRNKNKKIDDPWSLEKLVKTFEDIRDNRQMMLNVFKEKKD
jgi:hypothetical protein